MWKFRWKIIIRPYCCSMPQPFPWWGKHNSYTWYQEVISQMLINFLPADATVIGGCHHSRSHEFYCQSILHPTGYLGYLCESYEFFKAVSISAQELWALKKIIQVSTLMVGPAMCTEHLDAGGWALMVWFGRRMHMVRHSGSISYSALENEFWSTGNITK